MLVIRFQRVGKRHQPSYRVVVAERRSKLGAPPVEDLGNYNPKTKRAELNQERISYWLKNGAEPSVTVHNLLVKMGVISAAKIPVKIGQSKKIQAPSAPRADTQMPPAGAAERGDVKAETAGT